MIPIMKILIKTFDIILRELFFGLGFEEKVRIH
jgi:hypothetical protein